MGYSAFGLDGVARRAGVHKTTIYRRWGTRDDLILDAVSELGLEPVQIPNTGSLRDDLIAYAGAIATSVVKPPNEAIVRTFVGEAVRNPELAEVGRQYWATRFALAGVIVSRAVERGELPAATDPERVIELVLGPLYLRLLVTGSPLDHEYVEDLVDLVLAGAAGTRAVDDGGRTPR